MSIVITGGCCECFRTVTTDIYWDDEKGEVKIMCHRCYDKLYSPIAIRRRKVKKIMKRNLLKNLYRKIFK